MAKVSIQTIENLQNESSAIGKINANFAAVQTIIETLLSRDGLSPNHMQQLLDMNNQRIINLPAPIHYHEPARHGDIQQYVDEATAQAERAELEADEAATSAALALQSELQALAYLTHFLQRYMGALYEDPTTDLNGEPLTEGALYFNKSINTWRHYAYFDIYADTDQVFVYDEKVEVRMWMSLPASSLRSLSDVNAEDAENNDFLIWNTGLQKFVPRGVYGADEIPFSAVDTLLEADDVQEAIVEMAGLFLPHFFDISMFFQGVLGENEVLYLLTTVRPFRIPADTSAFRSYALTPALISQQITLRKNGVQFGTLTFGIGASTGVWNIPGDTTFAPGDRLSLTGPVSADTALRNVSVSIVGQRT